jgi:4-amino-4-deoxy-L-arabinose transferase-like glycosyltransferase
MDVFGGLLNFITDKKWSSFAKIITFLCFFLLAVFIDHLVGFTYYYWTENQLSQIEKIEALKEKYAKDKYLSAELNIMEERILRKNRNIISDYFPFEENRRLVALEARRDSIYLAYAGGGADTLLIVEKQPDSASSRFNFISAEFLTKKESSLIGTKFWHVFTSSYSFILTLVLLPFALAFQGRVNKETLIGLLVVTVAGLLMIATFSSLFKLLPEFKNEWANYGLNVAIHTLLVGPVVGLSYINDVKKRKKKLAEIKKAREEIKKNRTQ